MAKESPESVQVDCLESFDGGLPQGFLLELVELPLQRVIRNMSLLVSGISSNAPAVSLCSRMNWDVPIVGNFAWRNVTSLLCPINTAPTSLLLCG